MIDNGIVHGDKNMAVPVWYGKSFVYVHTDITTTPAVDEEGNETGEMNYSYHEYMYTFPEYLEIQAKENDKLKDNVINTQMAILELYESMDV